MKVKHLREIIPHVEGVSHHYSRYSECGLDERQNIIFVEKEEEGTCLTCAVTRVNHRKEKERNKESEEAKHGDASSR